jgi:hypothetical protein
MKMHWGSGGITPQFLTSALDEGEWLVSRPGRFTSGETAPGTHWIGSWVVPQTLWTLWKREKTLSLAENRTPIPGHPDRGPVTDSYPRSSSTRIGGYQRRNLRPTSSEYRTWGSHRGSYEEFYLLGYNAVQSLQPVSTLVSCLAYSSTLKIEATCSSETSVDFQ